MQKSQAEIFITNKKTAKSVKIPAVIESDYTDGGKFKRFFLIKKAAFEKALTDVGIKCAEDMGASTLSGYELACGDMETRHTGAITFTYLKESPEDDWA